jgi:hypothetical protein
MENVPYNKILSDRTATFILHGRSDERVDTRGPHPVYINGLIAVQLDGKPHSISLQDAREVANKLLG